MGRTYEQLSLEERCTIAELYRAGQTIRQIAATMDRSPSTVSREVKRNCGSKGSYSASYADELAWSRRWTGTKLERHPALRTYVLDRLAMGWSPQQVAGRMAREQCSIRVSHESIYRFIYAQYSRTKQGAWRLYLPRAKFKRGFRGRKGGGTREYIKHRVSISKRPKEVENRKRPGHWEVDLMLFSDKKQNLLVAQERTSRFILIKGQLDRKALTVAENQKNWFRNLPPSMRKTITQDNGVEFALHYKMNEELQMQTYFCNPHSPWQKGGIENINGRLRRYFPKKTNLTEFSETKIQQIALRINTTPRKCLDYKTPLEVFSHHLLHFKCESTTCAIRG